MTAVDEAESGTASGYRITSAFRFASAQGRPFDRIFPARDDAYRLIMPAGIIERAA